MKIYPKWKLQIEQLADTFMNQTSVGIRTLDDTLFRKRVMFTPSLLPTKMNVFMSESPVIYEIAFLMST